MDLRYVRPDGTTTCCDAYSTFMDDGDGGWVECCKACYETVVPSQEPVVLKLPKEE